MNLAASFVHRQPAAFAEPCGRLLTINAAVAEALQVDVSLLLAPTRCRAGIAFARQLSMYLAHTLLGMSYNEVAAAFHRDRTTVQHACSVVEDRRDTASFDVWLVEFEAKLLGRTEVRHDAAL